MTGSTSTWVWTRRPARTCAIVLVTAVSFVGLTLVAPSASASSQPQHSAKRAVSCTLSSVRAAVHLPKVAVNDVTAQATGSFTPRGSNTPIAGLPAFCEITLTETDSAGNGIHIEVWLPTKWNGRFQGVGGGGYSCGVSYSALASGIKGGYASASTDCGLPPDASTGSFALRSDGTLNWPLITDFSSVGIHDMSVVGQAVTKAFYTRKAAYSYFNGCSTGGREGLMEAQRYPNDYDGIAAGAPAINWSKFIPSEIWPELVMNETHDFLPTCKEDAFVEAAVKACDARDGVTDGVIADVAHCNWDAKRLIGFATPCGVITQTDATVMDKIWDGPRAGKKSANGRQLWFGLERGASLSGLGGTTTQAGVTSGQPFPIASTWLGTWLLQNPSWNWQTLTYAQFDQLFKQSVQEYSRVIATDNPNLSAFKRDGGKIVIWHGLADQLIFPQGTINYYQRVQKAMGGAAKTGSFARLFLAPGAAHCRTAAGPAPDDPLAAVVSWVEHGKAPRSLPATIVDPATNITTESRKLCAYPLVARYTGHGSTNDARNFTCARSYNGRR